MLVLLKTKLKNINEEKEKMQEYLIFLEQKLKNYGEFYNFGSTVSNYNNDSTKNFYKDETNNDFISSQTNNNGTFGLSNTQKVILDELQEIENSQYITKLKNNNNLPSLEEFNYILLKNFEGYQISKEDAEKSIFYGINNDSDLLNLIVNIGNSIKLENDEEKSLIKYYIITLYKLKGNDLEMTKNSLKALFENITIYDKKTNEFLLNKLKKYLFPVIKNFLSKIGSSNQITFFNLREIMSEINLSLKEKYTEYLIYCMKSSIRKNNKIFNLDCTYLKSIINNKGTDTNMNTSIEDVQNEDELVTSMLFALKDYLKGKKLRECFNSDEVFNPQSEDGVDLDLCVELNNFLSFLRYKVKYGKENSDKQAIFNRYNLDKDYNVISLDQIENDLIQITNSNVYKESANEIMPKSKANVDISNEQIIGGNIFINRKIS